MFFKQLYLGCLAQASYLLGDGGEVAVVDPRRDVDEYLAEARAQGLAIRHIIETHLHADFVSGHLDLAQATGARIYLGHAAKAGFPHVAVHEGDEIVMGQLVLRFLETPGHTPESICVLVIDRSISAAPQKVLTGDTLFIGDVGRPDLVGSRGYSPEQMGGMLYDSLHQKLLTLGDAVEIWPGHGAGSACGRNISSRTSSTLGIERRQNPALQPMTRDEFVRRVATELSPPPPYFVKDAEINRQGPPLVAELPPPRALDPAAVRTHLDHGAIALDVRPAAAYGAGHLPGSLNLGLSGTFAPWSGALMELEREVVLIADGAAEVEEARMRLLRVGFGRVTGYLDGGIAAWERAGGEVRLLPQMPVAELHAQLAERRTLQILDVRRAGEYAEGHLPGAINAPLDRELAQTIRLDGTLPTAVICASGYRSSAACSLLARSGFRELYNVVGGTRGWQDAGFPLSR
jgi:glyoxylase-like metal-dependent hydrolase (beta-lactamase superfamily II)/3-mercaptopyruvate sulfurtransferase SseA